MGISVAVGVQDVAIVLEHVQQRVLFVRKHCYHVRLGVQFAHTVQDAQVRTACSRTASVELPMHSVEVAIGAHKPWDRTVQALKTREWRLGVVRVIVCWKVYVPSHWLALPDAQLVLELGLELVSLTRLYVIRFRTLVGAYVIAQRREATHEPLTHASSVTRHEHTRFGGDGGCVARVPAQAASNDSANVFALGFITVHSIPKKRSLNFDERNQ